MLKFTTVIIRMKTEAELGQHNRNTIFAWWNETEHEEKVALLS